jgi:hypothetical protein
VTVGLDVQRNDFLLEQILFLILGDLKLSRNIQDDILCLYLYILLQVTFNISTLNKNCPVVFDYIHEQK